MKDEVKKKSVKCKAYDVSIKPVCLFYYSTLAMEIFFSSLVEAFIRRVIYI